MRLILAGGGNEIKSKIVDSLFASLLENKRILYIPIAMKDQRSAEECTIWLRNCLTPLGIETDTWSDVSNKTLADLNDYGGIYIGGGNTFSLLKDFKDTGFIDVLRAFIEADGLVYGGSAGAIILGKNILSSPDKNLVGLNDTKGLNLINDYNVVCHYKEKYHDFVENLISQNIRLIAIPEDSGIFVKNGKMVVIGNSSVIVSDEKGRRKIGVEEEIK